MQDFMVFAIFDYHYINLLLCFPPPFQNLCSLHINNPRVLTFSWVVGGFITISELPKSLSDCILC